LIADNPTSSRRALSKKLCEVWEWRQANGQLCDMICRGLMLQLHRADLLMSGLVPLAKETLSLVSISLPIGAVDSSTLMFGFAAV
jgi:hypothetical protein